MKVAFVPQPLDMIFPPMQSSIGIWTYEVTRRLARSGEVIVYSGQLHKKVEFDQGVHYRRLSITPDQWLKRFLNRFSGFYKVKRPLFASRLYYFVYARSVANDLRKRQCDIVHLHNLSQFVPVIRAFNPEIKIVLHTHCEWLTQLDPAMIERRLREVDLIIGCSEYVTEKIRLAFPQVADRCQVLHNGVDADHFCSNNGHTTTKATDAKRLLFVGRVSPEKGLHILIDAFCQVARRHPKVQLEIVGPETRPPLEFIVALSDDSRVSALAPFYERSYLTQLQERLPVSLSNHVSFSGPVPHTHLIDRYRTAGMFIFPSVGHEAFGMPIIEAMACQVPVVATRSGGIPEIVQEGKTGLLVERGDAAALAEAILLLLDNEDLRQTMGKAARQRVLERFSWERVAEDLFCKYESFMKTRRSADILVRTPIKRKENFMKTFTISGLLATLLIVAFVQAQDLSKQESPARLSSPKSAKHFLRSDLERHFHEIEMQALPRGLFSSQEDSLFDAKLSLPSWQAQNPNGRSLSGAKGLKAPSGALSGGVQEDWTRHHASGLVTTNAVVTARTIDPSGNVFVTGYTSSLPFSGIDYFTAKYNAAGVRLWSARYNAVESGDDRAFAIAVDASGNVYVTGESYGLETAYDYATIKYNDAGAEQWVARYNGPGNSDDRAIVLEVDAAGEVYVTGRSQGAGTNEDFATIKYNGAGAEQWVARYNGPANSSDVPHFLAVDHSGSVYVTGSSASTYITVKYDVAGTEQWVISNVGSGNDKFVSHALAVDDSGNVYLTGYSGASTWVADYATAKYNSAGTLQWFARYDGPANTGDFAYALAVDDSGNVYVTGISQTSSPEHCDYATVKYSSAGAEQWVRRYNGPGSSDDHGYALTLDAAGDIYVSGASSVNEEISRDHIYDYATIKYNSAGAEQWVARYNNGPGNSDDRVAKLALDPAGNVYVTGSSSKYGSGTSYPSVKYNSAGAEQWVAVARHNGPGRSSDEAYTLAIDPAGNVYVTGKSVSSSTGSDYATVKYNSAGVEQWVARYNGPGNSDDSATALAVDPAGNVYVTGASHDSSTGSDYATIKYNSAGEEQWVARYKGPGNSVDRPTALAIDPAGNVYVTGWNWVSGSHYEYATVKYNFAGTEQWVARNGSGNSYEYGFTALAVDPAGNVYVTGYSYPSGTSTQYSDYTTVKYNSAGTEQWVARYNGPGNSADEAFALGVDTAGNVYVTGCSVGSDPFCDYATIKYNGAGAPQWVARYNGPGNLTDVATELALDAAGNLYVAGHSSDDYATIKYNSAGAEEWVARYNGPANSGDNATALAVDPAGNVYVTGYSQHNGPEPFVDYATVKYNSAGAEQWVARYDGPGNSSDFAYALAVDHSGNVYVTGTSHGANLSWSIYTTIKYNQSSLISSVKSTTGEAPVAFELGSNYPNPFNPETTIQYAVPGQVANGEHVTLRIYNLQGQLVRTLVDEPKAPGRYRVVWDGKDDANISVSSGVYLYTITAGDFKAVKKMAILK